MLNHACTILESDFREVLYARLRAGFPSGFDLLQAYNLVQASFTQGKLQSSDAEKVKARASFLVSHLVRLLSAGENGDVGVATFID